MGEATGTNVEKNALIAAIDHMLDVKEKAIDVFIDRFSEPLGDVGGPEQVLGKKYADWLNPDDFIKAGRIYGPDSVILNKFIMRKELEKLQKAEAEVQNGMV